MLIKKRVRSYIFVILLLLLASCNSTSSEVASPTPTPTPINMTYDIRNVCYYHPNYNRMWHGRNAPVETVDEEKYGFNLPCHKQEDFDRGWCYFNVVMYPNLSMDFEECVRNVYELR